MGPSESYWATPHRLMQYLEAVPTFNLKLTYCAGGRRSMLSVESATAAYLGTSAAIRIGQAAHLGAPRLAARSAGGYNRALISWRSKPERQ